MMRRYVPKRFSGPSLAIIDTAINICEEYTAQGYDLTLRQLYYQFVARGFIANRQSEYKRLGSIINDARLAGLLDWDFIVDRTRNLRRLATWTSPGAIVESAASQYRRDLWDDQPYRVEVWVEKDALGGVIELAANPFRVPWFSCRGYTSQSELWGAAQRLMGYVTAGQVPVILHLGDHDPSGLDMTRDIEERLRLFMLSDWLNDNMTTTSATYRDIATHMGDFVDNLRGTWKDFAVYERDGLDGDWAPVIINRLALNMDQVRELNPPPNPAKLTDSRARTYITEHGPESWELDALDPATLSTLIRDSIGSYIDWNRWETAESAENRDKERLMELVETL